MGFPCSLDHFVHHDWTFFLLLSERHEFWVHQRIDCVLHSAGTQPLMDTYLLLEKNDNSCLCLDNIDVDNDIDNNNLFLWKITLCSIPLDAISDMGNSCYLFKWIYSHEQSWSITTERQQAKGKEIIVIIYLTLYFIYMQYINITSYHIIFSRWLIISYLFYIKYPYLDVCNNWAKGLYSNQYNIKSFNFT